MPRPTPAQFAYGSATVVFSTFAMLLLSQTSSGPGIIAIALAGLVLGVLVAMTAALPWGTCAAPRTTTPPSSSDTPEPAAPGLPPTRTDSSAEPAFSGTLRGTPGVHVREESYPGARGA
jgi:hypothetical protein